MLDSCDICPDCPPASVQAASSVRQLLSPASRDRGRSCHQGEAMPATLLPSASCSLKHTVSAPARKPLRVFRYVLSVSMNYFIPGSTSH